MVCKNCEQGSIPLGEHYVTHEMAIDAGIPEAEGSFYEIEYMLCECCHGDFENCQQFDEEEGVQAIIFLQSMAGITETEDGARAGWQRMDENSQIATMVAYKMIRTW
jgi:hypothetical protein